MLRTVLRNVQYYLLFFTILLVLLAFQRLQFLDRGWIGAPPHHPPFGDRPSPPSFGQPRAAGGGGGDYSDYSASSLDDAAAGRTMMRSVVVDESYLRSIDLFKFRLGLFEFVLPTWSSSSSSSSTVPLPPNGVGRRKKKKNKMNNIRGIVVGDIIEGGVESSSSSSTSSTATPRRPRDSPSGVEGGAGASGASSAVVAYAIATFATDSSGGGDGGGGGGGGEEEDDDDDDGVESRRRRTRTAMARALARSVDAAHADSAYGYKLYALNLGGGSSSSLSSSSPSSSSPSSSTMAVLRELAEAGFEVINVYGDDVATTTTTTAKEDRRLVAAKGEKDGRGWSLGKMLERHDIVVHLGGVNTMVVNPMDDIFDALSGGGVAGIGPNDVVGIVAVDDEDDEDDNGYSKREVTKKEGGLGGTTTSEEGRLMVDSYALESMTGSSGIAIDDDDDDDDDYDVGEFYVFKSSSRRASASYAKSLGCLQSRRRRRVVPSSSSSPPREGGIASGDVGQRPPVSPEAGKVAGGSSKEGVEDCHIRADENGGGNPRRLDRCLYDAASGRDCSHLSTSWDVARVARFPGGRSAHAGGAADAATSRRNDTEAEDREEGETRVSSGTPCDGPWEYPSEERCSNGQAGNNVQEEGICTYLCKKWFGFLVVEESEIG